MLVGKTAGWKRIKGMEAYDREGRWARVKIEEETSAHVSPRHATTARHNTTEDRKTTPPPPASSGPTTSTRTKRKTRQGKTTPSPVPKSAGTPPAPAPATPTHTAPAPTPAPATPTQPQPRSTPPKDTKKDTPPTPQTTKAKIGLVIHGVALRRELGNVRRWLSEDNKDMPKITGIRWLRKKDILVGEGKKTSSVVVYLEEEIGKDTVRLGGKWLKASQYESERGRR
ncbi:hypothetical protein BDZ91DRAFT_852897 [Kalaharituber pfeilii]|nr:hypothetical protein BDZ91DRAFT_852897 [Kalaharituber pfeilii]